MFLIFHISEDEIESQLQFVVIQITRILSLQDVIIRNMFFVMLNIYWL